MICKFNSFIEFSRMYSRENNNEDYNSGRQLLPLAIAIAIENIELNPEDIILSAADDPIDFIIQLSNLIVDLQYIAERTNEIYNTTYMEDDIQRIINQFTEDITE